MSTDETRGTAAAAATLLDAGAILRPGSTTRDDADTLTARTYTHPVLDGRRIVRLVPGTLGEAEDLALEFLGLARESEAPEVGQVRREALGFPAWALVNDPANGHHALALVKDIERLARQAKSRAGAAKDGFEALASRLDRAVPHFLPTFYEQAARIFLQHDNTTYAASFFGKARAAERVHGLPVDEERQRAVFLEFAFAGALTVKALKEHVKDLAGRLDPAAAWAQFRQLTVERCGAGMPPYASLPQDARSLVRAAGLDRAAEERSLVADLLASPAVVRAPASFWTAYRPTLVALAQEQPAVRARLLEFIPTGLGREVEHDEAWLSLLTETGAEALLTAETADGTTDGSADGADPADWLSRWATHRKHGAASSGRSPATLALAERMAPRLRADGRPVNLFTGRWHAGADLDLLDICLAEDVPLTLPDHGTRVFLPVARWIEDPAPGRRDLSAVAAHPRGAALLHGALDMLGNDRTLSEVLGQIAGHPVLSSVLHDWLRDRAGDFTSAAGLPGSAAALERLRPFRRVAARVNPDAVARIAGHDLAPLLGRTLRAGILDELGWPALEDAMRVLDAELSPKDRNDTLVVSEAWPALILARKSKALVVGPDKILLEHDLRIPVTQSSWDRPHFRYTDGELLVMWWKDGKQHAYWSSRPAEDFALGGDAVPRWSSANRTDSASVPLPGGGRATGGRALHAGDTVLPPCRPVLADGIGHWRHGKQGRDTVWAEYDPATGAHGRASLPAFLRSGIRDGARLRAMDCEVLPLQPGLEGTPFGTDGSVLGRWVRSEGEGADERTTAGTPDGRTVTLPVQADGQRPTPLGALRLPGGAAPVAAIGHNGVSFFPEGDAASAGAFGSVGLAGNGGDFAAGTRLVPPLPFWHALRPRDERGSAALRSCTDELAGQLLRTVAAAQAERQAAVAALAKGEEYAGPTALEVSRAAVASVLPDISDPDLLAGVTGIVREAVRRMEVAVRFVTPDKPKSDEPRQRTDGMFADYRPEHGDDVTIRSAVSGIAEQVGYSWWGGRTSQWTVLRQIRAVNHVLSGARGDGPPLADPALATLGGGWSSDDHTIPGMGLAWLSLLDVLHPLAYRAASPATSGERREALLLLLGRIAAGPLADPEGGLREIVLCEENTRQQRAGQVLRHDGRTVVVLGCQRHAGDRIHWLALDHDPKGRFGAVAHFVIHEERTHTPGFPGDRLAALVGLVRDKGPAPWEPDAPAVLAAATGQGLGPVQAAVLLAGRPQEPSAEALALLGLKAREASSGDGLLGSLGTGDRTALLRALLPEDPAALWDSGPDLAAAGRVWEERLGSFVRVTEDIAADLAGVRPATAEAVLNPSRTHWLSHTTVQRPDKDGNLIAEDAAALPSASDLHQSVAALKALAYGLPYGHPLRAALPGGLAALRRRLADPGLIMDLDVEWAEKGGTTAIPVRKAYGLPEAGGADADGLTRVGDAIVLRPWHVDNEMTLVRPAGLTGADDPVFDLLDGLAGPRATGLRAVRAILGDELSRAVHAGLSPDAPEGPAQDPGRSAPELVTEVVASHGLSEDAAVLYLQLLALPDPTDRNLARWTGWKPARIKKARTELAATALVVEAKRSRAGRGLFLPGGWYDLKSPALPVETWKEALYPVPHHTVTVPTLPVPELFARAWQRVRDGDAPAFEELTTRATRKGRRR